jgi:hypothetical protein
VDHGTPRMKAGPLLDHSQSFGISTISSVLVTMQGNTPEAVFDMLHKGLFLTFGQ